MLHQDISTCVNEIRELENLGEIRRAVPANYNSGNSLEQRTASQAELDQWDSPQRDGYLYGEHLGYHDFETCMMAKGWERVEFLPHADADKARQDYLDRYGKKRRRAFGERENVTSLHPEVQDPPPYEDLNQ
jgi:HD superfamily phosphohydrolase